jgi:hypothetical protein
VFYKKMHHTMSPNKSLLDSTSDLRCFFLPRPDLDLGKSGSANFYGVAPQGGHPVRLARSGLKLVGGPLKV